MNVKVHTCAQHVSFTVVGWLNHIVVPFFFFAEISVISYLFPPRVSQTPLPSIVLLTLITSSSSDNSHSTLHGILTCASLIVD